MKFSEIKRLPDNKLKLERYLEEYCSFDWRGGLTVAGDSMFRSEILRLKDRLSMTIDELNTLSNEYTQEN